MNAYCISFLFIHQLRNKVLVCLIRKMPVREIKEDDSLSTNGWFDRMFD